MSDASSVHLAMLDVIRNKDLDGLRDLYHPDYTYTGGDGVEHKGADAGIEVAATYLGAFPDLAFSVRHQFAQGNTSIIEFSARGTHRGELQGIPPTGRKVDVVVCNIVEVEDGKIYREREYFDPTSMMQQLGVTD